MQEIPILVSKFDVEFKTACRGTCFSRQLMASEEILGADTRNFVSIACVGGLRHSRVLILILLVSYSEARSQHEQHRLTTLHVYESIQLP